MKERLTLFQRYERAYGGLFGKKPKRHHFNFEIHLIDSCNLSCKGCIHFAPLARKESEYPIDEFERDLRRISEVFHGKFGWIHLLGGEPLLNKRIEDYLDIVGKCVKKGTVDLVTNGILLPTMGESFFAACKRNHIRIAITRYPIDFDYDKAMKLVLDHGCEAYFFGDRADGFCEPALVPESKASSKNNYLHCLVANACVTLDHGKLTYCSVPAFVRLYNEAFGNTFEDKDEWISIYDHGKKEILDFLRTPHEFCKHCDLDYRNDHLSPWAISKKEKEEWLR